MADTRISNDDHFWRWHDRMGIQRPGGPTIKNPRYRVGADGALVVIPYLAKQTEGRLKRAGYTGNGMPVVVPRAAPLPASQRPLYASVPPKASPPVRWTERAAELRAAIVQIELKLDKEWAEFDAGASPLPYRTATKKMWRDLNTDLARIEHAIIPAEAARTADSGPRTEYKLLVSLDKLRSKRRCFWCNDEKPMFLITRDHVIPAWVRKQMGLDATSGLVAACQDCNNDKGGMPPALYARIKDDRLECARQRIQWNDFAGRIREGERGSLLEWVIMEMERPIENQPVTKKKMVWTGTESVPAQRFQQSTGSVT